MFVSISQLVGYEDCLQNDIDCVGWELDSTLTQLLFNGI